MKTVIILESTDNVGKNLLARQLCKEYEANDVERVIADALSYSIMGLKYQSYWDNKK